MNPIHTLEQYALSVPEILLPREGVDLSRWAVIACDQYTQDRGYWEALASSVGSAPSTLNLILPEVYLEDGDRAERLSGIREAMKRYLAAGPDGAFSPPLKGMIYIERTTAYGRTRKGLVTAIDLDAYDWKPGSKAPIRATEATIVERIPPRMEIRRGASLESPHIMLLVNDPDRVLVEAAGARAREAKPVYSTALMPDSGSIKGWLLSGEREAELIAAAMSRIAAANTEADGSRFLFAVGDGNHSLATAKAVWDEFRKSELASGRQVPANHPARYALVEIVNLYDEGLTFEPIHRVIFGTDVQALTSRLAERLGGTVRPVKDKKGLEEAVSAPGTTRFGFVSGNDLLILESPNPALAVSRLQPVLDEFLKDMKGTAIDYIHGSDEVFRLGNRDTTVAILLPPVEKDSFFTTIGNGGPLPRKSFSMGEASEKRYYLECRKLFP